MKKKAVKTQKAGKKAKRAPLQIINVKMTEADHKRLIAKAKRFADGNLSAWVRYTGRVYTPKKGEKITLKAA